jgi:histidyl-tRNA synthetase
LRRLDVYALVTDIRFFPRVHQCLRAAAPSGVPVQMQAAMDGAHGHAGMKRQFKRADASGARCALVFGSDEMADGAVTGQGLA